MTKLNQQERKEFVTIIKEDLAAIQIKVSEQLNKAWDESRNIVIKELGHDGLIERKKVINVQMDNLREELNTIEQSLRSKKLSVKHGLEFGGRPDNYGRISDASFFHIRIDTEFDYMVAKTLKENIDFESPAKFLHNLARSALREITMAGTFEKASDVYETFYSLDFRKFGVDIPPRLEDIQEQNPLLDVPKDLQQKQLSVSKKKKSKVAVREATAPEYMG